MLSGALIGAQFSACGRPSSDQHALMALLPMQVQQVCRRPRHAAPEEGTQGLPSLRKRLCRYQDYEDRHPRQPSGSCTGLHDQGPAQGDYHVWYCL
jgi:hypothetical protein